MATDSPPIPKWWQQPSPSFDDSPPLPQAQHQQTQTQMAGQMDRPMLHICVDKLMLSHLDTTLCDQYANM